MPGSDFEGNARSRDVDRSHDVSRGIQRNFLPRFSSLHPLDTVGGRSARIDEDIRATREHSRSYPEAEGRECKGHGISGIFPAIPELFSNLVSHARFTVKFARVDLWIPGTTPCAKLLLSDIIFPQYMCVCNSRVQLGVFSSITRDFSRGHSARMSSANYASPEHTRVFHSLLPRSRATFRLISKPPRVCRRGLIAPAAAINYNYGQARNRRRKSIPAKQ